MKVRPVLAATSNAARWARNSGQPGASCEIVLLTGGACTRQTSFKTMVVWSDKPTSLQRCASLSNPRRAS